MTLTRFVLSLFLLVSLPRLAYSACDDLTEQEQVQCLDFAEEQAREYRQVYTLPAGSLAGYTDNQTIAKFVAPGIRGKQRLRLALSGDGQAGCSLFLKSGEDTVCSVAISDSQTDPAVLSECVLLLPVHDPELLTLSLEITSPGTCYYHGGAWEHN